MVAPGADDDLSATPGPTEAGHEFYSVPGAEAVLDDGGRFPGVYVVGDVTSVGTPKAGVAEGAARVVADQPIARIRGESEPPGYDGTGSCWIEFGDREVARVDVDLFSTPGHPTGTFTAPSVQTAAEKVEFGTSRHALWFGVAGDSDTVATRSRPVLGMSRGGSPRVTAPYPAQV